MNNIRLLLLLLIAFCTSTAYAQIDAGMHNTRYIYGTYTINNHYQIGVNHSVFSEKFGFQQAGISLGYIGEYHKLSYNATAFAATAWNGDYRIAGGIINLQYNPISLLHLNGTINPVYDSGYRYKTCFSAGASVDLNKDIMIAAKYTTIPDYRKSEKRLHGSFIFHSGPLSVAPTLSLPVAGEQKYKTLRVLVSLNYHFTL